MKERYGAEGEEAHVTEIISNLGLLPFPSIETEIRAGSHIDFLEDDAVTDGHYRKIVRRTSLQWRQRVIREYRLLMKARGVHTLSLGHFYYHDALSLQRFTLDTQGKVQIVVYPKILSMDEIFPTPLSLYGDFFVRRWILEDIFFPSGIRDYIHGDNLRFIDWKQSARHNDLKTRTYDYTNSNQLLIVLNLQTAGFLQEDVRQDQIEDIIRIAASLVCEAAKEGFAIGLLANGGCVGYEGQTLVLPPYQYQSPEQLYEYLARLSNFSTISLDKFLHQQVWLQNQGNVILVTGYMNEGIRRELQTLNAAVDHFRIITLGRLEGDALDDLPLYPAHMGGKYHV